MSEMVDRVAKALADIEAEIDADMFHYPYESRRDSYNALARAAIEAMRSPTPKMVQVVSANWGRRTWAEYNEVIDAALKD